MNIEMWGWPQWVAVILYALQLAYEGYMHGEPKQGTHNVGATMAGVAISALILGAGGFWL